MNPLDYTGKRVLLTQADAFMGPALVEVFTMLGATVIADQRPLLEADRPAELVRTAGRVDILLAHLALPAPETGVGESTEAEWRTVFAQLVDPLPRLIRAVLPQMIERRAGKILLMGSASALRGMKRRSTYSAAREVCRVRVTVFSKTMATARLSMFQNNLEWTIHRVFTECSRSRQTLAIPAARIFM